LAEEEGVSVNQLISLAVAEKLSAIDTERYLSSRASKGDEAKSTEATSTHSISEWWGWR
jgi:hypothetical protein